MNDDKTNVTHCYVQYISDKTKEIISVSQFVNCSVASLQVGKTFSVIWHNERSGTNEIHEAFVHLVGISEADIEKQLTDYETRGQRLKLPTTKVLSHLKDDKLEAQNVPEKKARYAAAKSVVNKEILQEKHLSLEREELSLNCALMEERVVEPLSKTDKNQKKEYGAGPSKSGKNTQKAECESEASSKSDNSEGQINGNDNSNQIDNSKGIADEAGTSTQTDNSPGIADGAGNSMEIDNSQERADGAGTSKNTRNPVENPTANERPAEPKKKKKLKRFETHKDKTYLGGGIFMKTDMWKSINALKDDGQFLITFMDEYWGPQLKDMCLNKKKAAARYPGQIRKEIPKKEVKALEAIYEDRLLRRGAKQDAKLPSLVARVRSTFTWRINDLNKAKKKPEAADLEDEEDGVVEED